MRGRALMYRGSAEDIRQAIAQFETAVQHDHTLAAGWAKLAEARHMLVMMGAARPSDAYPPAREAAARALAADATLADSHLADGLVRLWFDWNPTAAARAFERALALNESSAAAHHDYTWSLVALGRDDEAIAHITRARDLDPMSARANNDIGWLYLHLRRPADAARACQHTLAIQPANLEAQGCLERAFADRGLYDAALQAAMTTLPPGRGFTAPPAASPAESLKALWQWRLDRLDEASRSRWISPYTVAVQDALVGRKAQALDHLEAAVKERVGVMVLVHRDPAVDTLREEPRFRGVVEAVSQASR
jgi:tetratricopeptide (TPR) repeat protein